MSYHIVSIDSANCSLTCRDGQLVCRVTGEPERKLPLEDVASIIITSWSAQIHSELFLQAAKHGVALIICEAFKPVSLVLPANRSTDTLLSRALLTLPEKTIARLWQRTIDAKCANQLALAEQLAPADPRLAAFRATAKGRKPHKEAVCAKAFWQIFGTVTSMPGRDALPRVPDLPATALDPTAAGPIPHIHQEDVRAGQQPGPPLGRDALPRVPNLSPSASDTMRAPDNGGGVPSSAPMPPEGGSTRPRGPTGEDFTRTRDGGGLNDLLNYGYAVLLSTVLQKLFGVGLDPTWGISHAPRERATPLAYDLMEPFRPCVDWRVFQWVKQHPDPKEWTVTKEYRRWVTGFPLERVDYLHFTLEIQGVIEGVVRGFRRAVLEHNGKFYKPWRRDGEWEIEDSG